jgi:hypothetical protein
MVVAPDATSARANVLSVKRLLGEAPRNKVLRSCHTSDGARGALARCQGGRAGFYSPAMPTPVTGRCNLHTAATYGHPLGVQCRACERRVLVPLDKIGAGSMTLLRSLPLKCAVCGGREIELWLFVKRDEAEAWTEG